MQNSKFKIQNLFTLAVGVFLIYSAGALFTFGFFGILGGFFLAIIAIYFLERFVRSSMEDKIKEIESEIKILKETLIAINKNGQ